VTRRWRAALAAGLLTILFIGPAPSAEAQETPIAVLDQGDADPGDSIQVSGESWPNAVVVQAQVCGNAALNGSIDCDRSGAVTIGVGSDGRFGMELPVKAPPKPCPCVVLITSPDLIGTVLRLPIEVTGAPTAPPQQDQAAVPIFSITMLRVEREQPGEALFGISHERVVVMTVENLGATEIETLPITIAYADAPDQAVAVGSLENLAPGEREEVRTPFPVRALARGTMTVNVTIDQSGQALASSASFSTFPWALLAATAALLAVGAVGWGFRRRRRRRLIDVVDAAIWAEPFDEEPIGAGDPVAQHPGEEAIEDGHRQRRPPATVSRGTDRALSDDLARLIAVTLRDLGSVPPASDTDQLAERMAIVIVSELRAHHDFDPSAAVALTASIADELARELRHVVAAQT
jgi:hypothetical protein